MKGVVMQIPEELTSQMFLKYFWDLIHIISCSVDSTLKPMIPLIHTFIFIL